jgi:hypothetical protein
MKKVMMVIIAFSFASMTMLSCTQKAEDIKLSDLKTACDFVSAMGKIADAQIKNDKDSNASIEKGTWSEESSKNANAYREVLKNKLQEITEAAGKKYTEIEAKECPDFQMLEKKFKDSGLPPYTNKWFPIWEK